MRFGAVVESPNFTHEEKINWFVIGTVFQRLKYISYYWVIHDHWSMYSGPTLQYPAMFVQNLFQLTRPTWNVSRVYLLVILEGINTPYVRHHNLLLITNCSWILTIHKNRIFWKNIFESKDMEFKNGAKNIQAPGYNSAHRVA